VLRGEARLLHVRRSPDAVRLLHARRALRHEVPLHAPALPDAVRLPRALPDAPPVGRGPQQPAEPHSPFRLSSLVLRLHR
jgi:hypothetical protein